MAKSRSVTPDEVWNGHIITARMAIVATAVVIGMAKKLLRVRPCGSNDRH
jgi:hypothetical protein